MLRDLISAISAMRISYTLRIAIVTSASRNGQFRPKLDSVVMREQSAAIEEGRGAYFKPAKLGSSSRIQIISKEEYQ